MGCEAHSGLLVEYSFNILTQTLVCPSPPIDPLVTWAMEDNGASWSQNMILLILVINFVKSKGFCPAIKQTKPETVFVSVVKYKSIDCVSLP